MFISLVFLCVFLWIRPYRRSSHNMLQACFLAIPIVAMGWSLSGGWEDEMKVNSPTETFKADDTLGANVLVYLHMFVIAVPLFLGLFFVLSFFYVMFRYKLPAAVKPVATGKGKK